MKLSLIIPHYRESEKVIGRLLNLIDYQVRVDFNDIEVIVINDGLDVVLSDELMSSFTNIKPIYIKLPENKGPGLARQAGIDAATGDWIAFCDADDMFYSCLSLLDYLQAIRKIEDENLDTKLAVFEWYEELVDPSFDYALINRTDDLTWLHAKLFKRSFLTDNNIRFSDEFTTCAEDKYFMTLVHANIRDDEHEILYVHIPVWIWLHNEESITRKEPVGYIIKGLDADLKSTMMGIEYFEKNLPEEFSKHLNGRIAQIYCGLVSDAVYLLQEHVDEDTIKSQEKLCLKYVAEIFDRWGPYVNLKEVGSQLKAVSESLASQHGVPIEVTEDGFDQFIAAALCYRV